MFFKKKEQSLFSRYEDPSHEFSNKNLELSRWYVLHKELLYKIFVIVLIIWSVITVGIGLFVWGKYLIYDYPRDEAQFASMSQNLVSYNALTSQKPRDIEFGAVSIWNTKDMRYDFSVPVSNQNENWLADVDYHASYNDQQSDIQHAVILPGQRRLLVVFGESTTIQPRAVSIDIDNIRWRRVDRHAITSASDYISHRIDFSVSDVNFLPAGTSVEIPHSVLRFTVENNSPFSYWEIAFIVLLKEGDRVTGLSYLVLDTIDAHEKKAVDMSIFSNNTRVTAIELQPLLNVFDEGVYR